MELAAGQGKSDELCRNRKGKMATVNENFLKLQAGYLFSEIGRRRRAFEAENPNAKIISLGIGDVTEPLAAAVIEAMHKAIDEMSRAETYSEP